jgi:hypothetical protein
MERKFFWFNNEDKEHLELIFSYYIKFLNKEVNNLKRNILNYENENLITIDSVNTLNNKYIYIKTKWNVDGIPIFLEKIDLKEYNELLKNIINTDNIDKVKLNQGKSIQKVILIL